MVARRLAGFTLNMVLIHGIFLCTSAMGQEWKSGIEWKEPPVVQPGATNREPPSDAIVLFDGTDLSQWEGGEKWLVQDGVAIPRAGEIKSKQAFGDVQLHIEWAAPTEIEGEGQGRGNSGVFLMGLYEVQILDSFENETYFDGQAASIYKQTPPMVNAMRRPGQWNTYDILFTAPRFRVNGALSRPAHVTVIHNGVVVLNHFEILGPTGFTQAPFYAPHAEKLPIALQFHNDPVQFRNIWARELKPPVGRRVGPPYNIERPKPARRKRDKDSDKDQRRPADKPDRETPEAAKAESATSQPSKSESTKPESNADTPKSDTSKPDNATSGRETGG